MCCFALIMSKSFLLIALKKSWKKSKFSLTSYGSSRIISERQANGVVSERFKVQSWKGCVAEMLPRVRIPATPPFENQPVERQVFLFMYRPTHQIRDLTIIFKPPLVQETESLQKETDLPSGRSENQFNLDTYSKLQNPRESSCASRVRFLGCSAFQFSAVFCAFSLVSG